MRPNSGGKTPPFVIIGLLVVIAILGFNYWSLSSKNADLGANLDEVQMKYRSVQSKKLELEKHTDKLNGDLNNHKQTVEDKDKHLRDAKQKEDELKAQIQSAAQELEAARNDLNLCDDEVGFCHENITRLIREHRLQLVDVASKCQNDVDEARSRAEQQVDAAQNECNEAVNEMRLSILRKVQVVFGTRAVEVLNEQQMLDISGIDLTITNRQTDQQQQQPQLQQQQQQQQQQQPQQQVGLQQQQPQQQLLAGQQPQAQQQQQSNPVQQQQQQQDLQQQQNPAQQQHQQDLQQQQNPSQQQNLQQQQNPSQQQQDLQQQQAPGQDQAQQQPAPGQDLQQQQAPGQDQAQQQPAPGQDQAQQQAPPQDQAQQHNSDGQQQEEGNPQEQQNNAQQSLQVQPPAGDDAKSPVGSQKVEEKTENEVHVVAGLQTNQLPGAAEHGYHAQNENGGAPQGQVPPRKTGFSTTPANVHSALRDQTAVPQLRDQHGEPVYIQAPAGQVQMPGKLNIDEGEVRKEADPQQGDSRDARDPRQGDYQNDVREAREGDYQNDARDPRQGAYREEDVRDPRQEAARDEDVRDPRRGDYQREEEEAIREELNRQPEENRDDAQLDDQDAYIDPRKEQGPAPVGQRPGDEIDDRDEKVKFEEFNDRNPPSHDEQMVEKMRQRLIQN